MARLFFCGVMRRKSFLIMILRFGAEVPKDHDDGVTRSSRLRVRLGKQPASEAAPTRKKKEQRHKAAATQRGKADGLGLDAIHGDAA
jgi:hypothetical protein